MRGQSIIMAAAAADIAQNFLRQLGCKVEILGFTTSSWRGGKSRIRWERSGEMEKPGRLCDLLHIVYRSAADTRISSLNYGLKNMLRPDLLKENVDGEALEWASERLFKRDETSKLLLVLSDGAPVDDSTLKANGPYYLIRHLAQVISRLESDERIHLMAIGLGHDVGKYYKISHRIDSSDQFGLGIIDLLKNDLINLNRNSGEKD
ncbi:MAG TPA: CobT protein [Pararhizobium sp.]|uniref:cobaltochelatase CobT-related protein n=1 Tax=Pararhizobium sp. TaxID=1977563 RepID=UPI002BC5ECB0|nr:CobT protein [Pararhizobium sp.]HTO30311.1 CobT protein [Pararhizobium sp.]